jgi:isobutyryl-CoA mutase
LIRSSSEDKDRQIANLRAFQDRNREAAETALADLQKAAVQGDNLFESLMEAAKVASLGQMSRALYDVGGQYRRNMSAPPQVGREVGSDHGMPGLGWRWRCSWLCS